MSVEPDKLTIYPIGIDRVPNINRVYAGWVEQKDTQNGESKLEPRIPMRARLIEGPIVVETGEVDNIDRPPMS